MSGIADFASALLIVASRYVERLLMPLKLAAMRAVTVVC